MLTPGRSQQGRTDHKTLFSVKISAPVTLLGEGKAVALKLSGHGFGDSSVLSGQIMSKDGLGVCERQLKSPLQQCLSVGIKCDLGGKWV